MGEAGGMGNSFQGWERGVLEDAGGRVGRLYGKDKLKATATMG